MDLNLSACNIPNNVHALQWFDTQGWIEYKDNLDGTKPANEPITVLPNWASLCVTMWENYIPPEPLVQPTIPTTVV